ncbi:hypothetical protein [Paenibacillus larvae]|uniref:hypothetical protein n=1 Tax=Paenibacillus larvae TaxID=1464 RepID=UPI00288F2817|nr:hypothetical protein [Paenibacillus larvae]MDT2278143.1 hypothetical protein [Paenibacillus larvae]
MIKGEDCINDFAAFAVVRLPKGTGAGASVEGGGGMKYTRESIIAKWDTLSNLDRDEWVATAVMDIMGWSWSYQFYP